MYPVNDGESVTNEGEGESPTLEQDDELWDEVASERGDPPADEAAGADEDPAEPDEVADAKAGPDEGSAENEEAAGANSDPPASEASSDDIWANAPPELKAAFDAANKSWETRFNSVKARQSAQDRLLDALRSSGSGQGGKKARALLDDDAFKSFRQEYGENLGPVISILESLADRQDAVDGAVETASQARGEAHVDEQLALYAEAHPDWASYATDDRYDPWLRSQPRHMREAAERNAQYIVDAGEAIDVLSRFKEAMGIGKTPDPTPPPPADENPSGSERRNRQRDGAKGSGFNGGPPTTVTEPQDEDALWASISAKRDRQRL
jgi:hypothetical protein